MKIRVLLSYDGTHFAGWQRQTNKRTVQGEIETALAELFQEKIPIFASGRTDRGVHALGQVIHFEILKAKLKKINLIKALNHLTGPDISLTAAWQAPKDFHARFSAEKKTYLFLISTQKSPPALGRHFLWWLPAGINPAHLNQMAEVLIGAHDFKGFYTAGSEVSDTVRTVYEARWVELGRGTEMLYCHRFRLFKTNDKKLSGHSSRAPERTGRSQKIPAHFRKGRQEKQLCPGGKPGPVS